MPDQELDQFTIGKILLGAESSNAGRTIELTFADGVMALDSYGECCTETYFSDIEHPVRYPCEVMAWDESVYDRENDDGGGVHDTEFVTIATRRGPLTFTLHSEHNGYYGGQFHLTWTPDAAIS